MAVNSEASVVAMSCVLGRLDAAVLVAANMPLRVLHRLKDKLISVRFSFELTVAETVSEVKIPMVVDAKEFTRVLHRLQLHMSGLATRVDAMDLPLSGLAISSVHIDVFVGFSAEVLARSVVLQGDDATVMPREKSCHCVVCVCEFRKASQRERREKIHQTIGGCHAPELFRRKFRGSWILE